MVRTFIIRVVGMVLIALEKLQKENDKLRLEIYVFSPENFLDYVKKGLIS